MKMPMPPINKLNIALTALSIIIGVALTVLARSWVPLMFMSALVIVPACVLSSALMAIEIIAGVRPWNRYSSLHIGITFSALAIVLVGIVSIVERVTWFNADVPPSITIAKEYGDRYSTNKHRYLKFACERRGGSPMNLREVGDQVYVRCGEWYPEVYTISASTKAFAKAEEETRNDPPHMGFILEID